MNDKIQSIIHLHAMGQWLSEWPEDWDYEKVLDYLYDHDNPDIEDGVIVWEMAEHKGGPRVAEMIEDTARSLKWFVQEVLDASKEGA